MRTMLLLSSFLPMTNTNTAQHNPETNSKHTAKQSSQLLRKAKQTLTSVLAGAAMLGAVDQADAQIQELGTTDDGARNSWLLKDMGQEIVKWDESFPNQQSFAIYKINTPDPEDWRDDSTTIFGTANSEIGVDDIGDNPSEIVETEVEGRQARKILHDQLAPGRYVLQTKLHASAPDNPNIIDTWTTRLFVEVDETGNQEVFKIQSVNSFDTNPFWGNRIGANEDAIEFTELGNDEIEITLPVPTIADGSDDMSLDMDEWRQSGASLTFELNDGTEITKTADEIDYDHTNNTLTTSIQQENNQRIVGISTQHEGLEPMEVTGPLDVPQFIAKSIKVYPNPVSPGQPLNLQLPEGIAALNVAYAIYDMTGREVMHGTLDNKTALMHNLSSGVYLLKLGFGQTVHSKKFVVE